MYTYKSHLNNINFITKKPFQVALTKEAFLSVLMKQQGTLFVDMYVAWHPHGSVQILFKFWISSGELKSRLETWISWKVVAACTCSLQMKQ